MSDYLSPGVYIQELEGPAPIVGVSTSIAAFVGMAERGPVNVPILCTGVGDYTRWFGGQLYYDEFQDPNDPDRSHCYLPYAVAGFYNNSGQVLYVMRVVPDGAAPATETLFDRGISTSVTSTLIRGASYGAGLGTTVASGALVVLAPPSPAPTFSPSTPGNPAFIRIGSGSASEYLQIAESPVSTVSDSIVLDQPLQNSHAAGAACNAYARTVKGGPATLQADATQGETAVAVNSPDPLVTYTIGDWFIELVGEGAVVVAIPTAIASLGTNLFLVTFNLPLAAGFAAASTSVNVLAVQPAIVSLNLDAAASGGDLLLYGPDAGLVGGQLIDIEPASSALREVRTLGQLCELTFAQPTDIDWPAGTIITPVAAVAAPPDTTLTAAVAAGAATLSITDRTGINAGTVLKIDTGASLETVTVQSVALPRTAAPDTGALTLVAGLVLPHPSGAAVAIQTAATTALQTAAVAGAQSLSLASRVGIGPGTMLAIGAAPEYAAVLALQGSNTPIGSNPGNVLLTAPLLAGYPAATAVVASTPAPPSNTAAIGGPRASRTLIDAPASAGTAASATALVTWPAAGWTAGGVVQISLPDDSIAYNAISPLLGGIATPILKTVTLTAPVQNTHPPGDPVIGRDPLIQIQALDAGAWGNRLAISVQDESPGLVSQALVSAYSGPTQLKLQTPTGVQPGSYLEMYFVSGGALVDPATPLKVSQVNISTGIVTFDGVLSGLQQNAAIAASKVPPVPVALRSREFRLTVNLYRHPDPAVPARNTQIIQSETYRNLSMDPRHNQYFQTVIGAINGKLRLSDQRPEGASWLIRTQDNAATLAAAQAPRLGPEVLTDTLPNGLQRPAQIRLANGDDSMPNAGDAMYVGADADDPTGRSGIFALLNVPQISIVAVPGQGTQAVQAALIDHCETSLFRFAILDPQYSTSAIADIQAQRQQFDTKFAALYYPWLTIPDPLPVNLNNIADFPVPPSGYIAGIYARVDDQRGVFKAPANEVVQGITGLTATLAQGDQDVLNPSPTNINVIRDFRQNGRGLRVWGARVMTSDANYTYVPVKRLMMFIEQSLEIGLQDLVFEPNGPPLWASVERVIGNFLTTVWASGALQGSTPEQSFFVQCGLKTMSQTDIDNGRLIAVVGVAPVYPAEFVIIQISLTVPATSN